MLLFCCKLSCVSNCIEPHSALQNYSGKLLSVFNSQSTIEVGGVLRDSDIAQESQYRKRRASRAGAQIDESFIGQMGNLIFNGIRVFEQAKQGSFTF